MELTKHSLPFITGMGYRHQCDFHFDEFNMWNFENQFDGMNIFIKTDLLNIFFQNINLISKKFNIYTHNSDINIDEKYNYIFNYELLIMWYSVNVNIENEKIESIPIGIANSRWEHGNIDKIKKIIDKNNKKSIDVFCSFDINTNYKERINCINNINVFNNYPIKFEEYLELLSKSKYSICPEGNGIDTHRVWESIYLNTIPIVTKSIHMLNLSKKYDMVILNKWEDFKNLNIN
jgi:hypothetical protein